MAHGGQAMACGAAAGGPDDTDKCVSGGALQVSWTSEDEGGGGRILNSLVVGFHKASRGVFVCFVSRVTCSYDSGTESSNKPLQVDKGSEDRLSTSREARNCATKNLVSSLMMGVLYKFRKDLNFDLAWAKRLRNMLLNYYYSSLRCWEGRRTNTSE
ncbi:mediator of RNA polymerase II transcription subunit [Striga asiatica]|uniref:Mediator of RNA polymerase II transcription subunit n=1 Tax=Striga asiatica TaxID=4170 RepID=A0A5A7QL61_STRAF|nr:mediator of RNA polymerase II transcription subunit [Striga asiatica]